MRPSLFVPVVTKGQGAGGAWSPGSLSGLLQRFGDGIPLAYAGTLNSFPYITPEEPGTLAVPRAGRCALFDGSNDIASTTTRFNATGDITFTAWVKSSDLLNGSIDSNGGRGIARSTSTGLGAIGDWNVTVKQGGAVCFSRWTVGGASDATGRAETAAGVITINTWYHIAVTWNGTVKAIYVNGAPQSIVANNATDTGWGDAPFEIGRHYVSGLYYWVGSLSDVRVYNVAKSPTEILAIKNQHLTPNTIDTTGALGIWPLQEENVQNGGLHYDVSGNGKHLTTANITASTYNATDSGVKHSFANAKGYTLSGDIVIPASLATPTQDAAGNALGVTGPVAYPATTEVPCFTGDGAATYIAFGSQLIASGATAWVIETLVYLPTLTSRVNCLRQGNTTNGISVEFYIDGKLYIEIWTASSRTEQTLTLSGNIAAATWVKVKVDYDGSRSAADRMRLYLDDVLKTLTVPSNAPAAMPTMTANTECMKAVDNSNASAGRLCGWSLTTGGVTKYPKFDECGPGSANTNRDFYIMGSDGSATLVTGGIVSGTIANIYANRCPYVQDWCVNYGGGIAANGAFIPGRIGSANDAAGNVKTLVAGKHGNPYSRVVPNVWNAPALVNGGVDSSDKLAPADTYESITTATDDGFSRHASDGTDRYFKTLAALTGTDLTNADAYTA